MRDWIKNFGAVNQKSLLTLKVHAGNVTFYRWAGRFGENLYLAVESMNLLCSPAKAYHSSSS